MAKSVTKKSKPKCVVGVVMGSDSDLPVMQRCLDMLSSLGIGYEVRVISAHRTPEIAHEYAVSASRRGLKVLIAAAGMSAALGGVLAANTTLPVIGVPMASGPLVGIDAALSTMQMPPGVPVACMAIDKAGATNAGIFAAQVLAVGDKALTRKLAQFKRDQVRKVVAKDQALKRD